MRCIMSRQSRKKKKKRNHLQDFKTRATCPDCSSGKVTMLNKNRHIFKCLSCDNKFGYDDGVYFDLASKKEQQDVSLKMDMHGKKEIHEEKVITAKPSGDSLDDFFESMKL